MRKQTVRWGDQTTDEMHIAFLELVIDAAAGPFGLAEGSADDDRPAVVYFTSTTIVIEISLGPRFVVAWENHRPAPAHVAEFEIRVRHRAIAHLRAQFHVG
jgi:hypothetical protein